MKSSFELKIILLFVGFCGIMLFLSSELWHIPSVTAGIFSMLYFQWPGRIITSKEKPHD